MAEAPPEEPIWALVDVSPLEEQTSEDTGPGWSRGRPVLLFAIVLLVLAIGGGIAYGVARGGPGANLRAREVLLKAAVHTLSKGTARITMTGLLSVQGFVEQKVHEHGLADFSRSEAEVSTDYQKSSMLPRKSIRDIYTESKDYVSTPQITSSLHGKQWVEEPIDYSPSSGSEDPLALLGLVSEPGAKVRPIGEHVVVGQRLEGYRAVVNPSFVKASIRRQEKQASPAAKRLYELGAKVLGRHPVTLLVYVDPKTDTVHQVASFFNFSLGGYPVTMATTTRYTALGTRIALYLPAKGDVASLSQFGSSSRP